MRKLHTLPAGVYLKNTLLAFWLLTLPASGFAPLFYSSGSQAVAQEQPLGEGTADLGSVLPEGADSQADPGAGVAPKNSVNFWLIAGATPASGLSTAVRGKRLSQRSELIVCFEGLSDWRGHELGACNRSATVKAAEFTLLGLKPSGVS